MAKLLFFCGKMASGKSTLARDLAARSDAILLEQDHWLATLFRGEIDSISDYVQLSGRLTEALATAFRSNGPQSRTVSAMRWSRLQPANPARHV